MAGKYKWSVSEVPRIAEQWKPGDSLGQKIEIMLTRFIQRVIIWCMDFISDRLVDVFDNSMKIMRPGTDRVSRGIVGYMKSIPNMPAWFQEMMRAVETEEGESSFLIKLAVYFVGIRSLIFGGLEPLQRIANYNADREARSFLPDVPTLASMKRTGIMSEEGYINSMQQMGVHDKLIPAYLEFVRNLPNLGDIIAGRWRGVISDAEFHAFMLRMGYDPKDIGIYEELSHNLPPLTDLIHMLVRDAFNDSISAKFGYDEDLPEDLGQYFEKQGYSKDWMLRYWRAHWNLPSPTQAYEMLHRGLIDQHTLDELLKTADYPKFWREKLSAISYSPYTRVDIRRMYQAGVLNETEVLQAYKDIGYNEERAQKLTEFTIRMISQEERDLTRGDLVGAYEDGLTDRGATLDALVKMGYDSEEGDTILKQADFNIAKAARTEAVNWVKEQYLIKAMDKSQATLELTQAGLTTRSIDRYLLSWGRAVSNDVKILTRTEAESLYMKDIITEAELEEQLTLNKYSARAVAWLMLSANNKKSQANEEQA
jgi:hypothetical protein